MITIANNLLRDRSTELWTSILLAATLFAIPLSSTGKSILIPVVVLMIILSPMNRQALREVIYKPWCLATFFLLFFALLGCLWGPATPHEKVLVLEKYSKLLYLPILVIGFKDPKARQWGINAFVFAMLITCLLSIYRASGLLNADPSQADELFRNHIMTSHMMVFATYLLGLACMQQTGWKRLVYLICIILFSYQILFINTGRTGYVLYPLFMMVFIIQVFSWKKAIGAVCLGSVLFVASYFESPMMQTHIKAAITDYQAYHHADKNSSIGYRMQFHDFANTLFLRHPWLGNGTAGFTALFREENPVPSWSRRLLEPHSQYWLIAAEFGIVGCLLFIGFLGSLLLASIQLPAMSGVAFVMLLSFTIGNLSDSLLFYSGSGYFFLTFMALCLGCEENNRRSQP